MANPTTGMHATPSTATISQLLPKITDQDSDYRFMALNDLLQVLEKGKEELLKHDFNIAQRTVDQVIKSLDDANGEVQNQAIKCLGPLVRKVPPGTIGPLMEKLTALELKNSVDVSVPSLALKAVVTALPRANDGSLPQAQGESAYAISRVLIPRLLRRPANDQPGGLLLAEQNPTADTIDVLIELVSCFGPSLAAVEVEALEEGIFNLMMQEKRNSVLKKRAVVAISMLARYFSDELLTGFIQLAIEALTAKNASSQPVTRRLFITILGSLARSIPQRVGQYIPKLVSMIVQALSQDEYDAHLEELGEGESPDPEFHDVREAALVALDAFLSSCPAQMRPYAEASIEACLRYLKYDPNYAVYEDEDEDMEVDDDGEESDSDDEFELEAGFDDDDDASWKVRRCAAKALCTIISTMGSGDLLDDGVLYRQVAPALVKRFDEREENVRLEVIAAMSLLVRKTGQESVMADFPFDSASGEYMNQLPMNRKRRRQSSAGGATAFDLSYNPSALSGTGLTSPTSERIPSTGPRADLASLTPFIVKASTKLLNGKLIATKQAIVKLLDDIVVVQHGTLDQYFDQLMDLLIESIKFTSGASMSTSVAGGGGNASATASTLRIAALRLTSNLAKYHSSSTLQPFLSRIIAGVVSVVHDRYYKISSQAIQTAEELVKAITPPRSRLTAQNYKGELQELYSVIVERTTANDADAEVRQNAIHALGILVSRTSGVDGAPLLAEDKHKAALEYLLERLKNETTRLAAVRAVDTVAVLADDGGRFESPWICQVAIQLAGQLRKANRALRGSSVMALKHLVLSRATRGAFDDRTVDGIVTALGPVITNNDAQLLGPGLMVLAHFVPEMPNLVVTHQVVGAICQLVQSTVADTALASLLALVTNIGQAGAGQPLMTALLQDVGVNGDPTVIGKVIGALLVASGGDCGVTLDSFVQEIQTSTKDAARLSLALTVLGEAGLRLGTGFPLQPEVFLAQFKDGFDKVSLSAAIALGRAGAGNISGFLPIILEALKKPGNTQYLLLQSIKEILQQAASFSADISMYSSVVWTQLLNIAHIEDNKAVCAECVGRMVIIDPQTYMPKLEALLKQNEAVLRDIAVQALRYTLPDENEAFDTMLKSHLVPMLKLILDDPVMEIRRHAMSTLNSASHNKPELILSQLNQLMPYVMRDAVIKPELVREVQMGPFKHIIDDGLEVRKAAYETLYALMETAFSRLDVVDLYDRIAAGLSDDHDIRSLCNLMVQKLAYLDPVQTELRLDAMAEAFRATLSHKLKDTAVKQELEKQQEAIKAVLRVTMLLCDKFKTLHTQAGASASHAAWLSYVEWVNKDFRAQIGVLKREKLDAEGSLD